MLGASRPPCQVGPSSAHPVCTSQHVGVDGMGAKRPLEEANTQRRHLRKRRIWRPSQRRQEDSAGRLCRRASDHDCPRRGQHLHDGRPGRLRHGRPSATCAHGRIISVRAAVEMARTRAEVHEQEQRQATIIADANYVYMLTRRIRRVGCAWSAREPAPMREETCSHTMELASTPHIVAQCIKSYV